MVPSAPSPVSLNTILPEFSAALAVGTPAQIYERQRQLVRAGLLASKKGMGPGSGVAATPHNVALVLIALLAVQRGDAVKRTKLLANAKPVDYPCPYTGSLNLVGVLAAIFRGRNAFAAGTTRWWPNHIIVSRDSLGATVRWPLDQHGFHFVDAAFTSSGKSLPVVGLQTQVVLNGGFFPRFSSNLRNAGHALTEVD